RLDEGSGTSAFDATGNAANTATLVNGPQWTTSTTTPSSFNGRDVFGPVTSLGHNFISETNGSTGWLAGDLKGSAAAPLDPLLGPLADNCGPTRTHALLTGSPCLNTGDNASLVGPWSLVTDQRGLPRRDGVAVDIGAYEAQTHIEVANTNDSGPGSL